jgi:hypothetical protein
VAVVFAPQLYALAHRRTDCEDLAGMHGLKQLSRQLNRSDFLALRFDPYRVTRLEATQLVDQKRVEPLLRRQARQFAPGVELQDWLEAEKEVKQRLQVS